MAQATIIRLDTTPQGVHGGKLRTSNESKEALRRSPADLDTLNIHWSIRPHIRHGLEQEVKPYYR